MPPAPALRLRALSAGRHQHRLGPVTLDLPAACYGCLLGPPGAGKTLLLHAVAGLTRCSGSIEIAADRVQAISARGRGCALLAQGGAPAPIGTVRGALHAAMAARGIDAQRRAGQAAALCEELTLDSGAAVAGLDPFATFRLRLAVALAGAPRLLLLDDPLAHCAELPAAHALLRATTRRRKLAVLHATTRRQDAYALADLLVLLQTGQVLQGGSIAQLYERPASLAIAQLLGQANILPGRLVMIDNDVATIELACGPAIEADPPQHEAPIGAACQVLLRPERVSVSTLPPAQLGPTAIAAMVREVMHAGETIRLLLAIGTDQDILVARPAALGMAGLVPGRTVSIAWQSHHALTFVDNAP